jgi:hypothetical protein
VGVEEEENDKKRGGKSVNISGVCKKRKMKAK